MPLPDERPRGSVANLIGRFENQVKRQPSSSPASARSLSVVSHISGDSTKEEAKERHDWPPQSTSPDVKPPIVLPSSSFAQSLAIAQAASADATLGTPTIQAQADLVEDAPSSTPRPSSVTSDSNKPKTIMTPRRQFSIDIITPTPDTPTTAKPPMTAKPPTAKPAITMAGRPTPATSGRAPVKSTAPRSSTTTAIKPQNPSSTFSPPRRPVTKPTPAPSAHASAKATVRTTAVPTSTRPKTPSTMFTKTPSSGLFAPTAASLAKSRNAQQPPLPTPTKKVLNSSVAERLSKPTAASLSRARTPTAATPRTGVKPASASPATRGTPASKPRTTVTRTPAKKAGVTPIKQAATAAADSAELEPEVVVTPDENEHQADKDHIDEPPEDAVDSEQFVHEQEYDAPIDSNEAEAVAGDDHLNGDILDEANNDADIISPNSDHESESHDTTLERSEKSEGAVAPINGGYEAEIKPEAHLGTEIEDMVSLLESVSISKVRPESIASIPDEE